jgi:hypothetical protein
MTIRDVKDNFVNTLTESRDLFNHCLSPVGLHTDSGVEAAFLQIHKNWEVFLEEILICFLNGKPVLAGDPVTPLLTVNDRELIRSILYQDKNYIEWTDEEMIRKRFKRHLSLPNRVVDCLNTISQDLKDITIIRNFIAHSSGTAKTKYENRVRARLGGNPDVSRASLFLKSNDREDPTQTYFDRYIGTLEAAAEQMVGN